MKLRRLMACFLLFALLMGAAAEAPAVIWHATDPHHLSSALTDYGSLFYGLMGTGDGKLTEHSGELIDALLAAAREAQPDALVITGDLTFNGERESLVDLLGRLRGAGVPVLLLPGNHDISNPYARGYFGHSAVAAPNVSQAEFAALCAEFGPDQALARDENSFSYIYAVNDSLWLLLLDANTDTAPGAVPERTLEWLAPWLRRAQDESVTVLSFTHQNLLPVNQLFADDFVISNCAAIRDLYAQYGVRHNFSGHAHLQHLADSDSGLFEAVTGALCVSPLHYGVITVDGGVSYASVSLPVWREAAAERFRLPLTQTMRRLLVSLGVSGEPLTVMVDFAVALSEVYFAGDTEAVKALRDDPAWEMWGAAAQGTFWYTYLWSLLEL